jgi:NtrC-family two-component system sensor histidine kinase KinB
MMEPLWRELFDQSQDGLALTSGPTHVVECMNPRLCELWGQPRDRSAFRFDEVVRDVDVTALHRVYATGAPETSPECEHRLPDGSLGSFVYMFSPRRDSGGGVCGLMVTVRETTDPMRVRRESVRTASTLRSINERLVVSSVREQELAEAEATQRAQLHALLDKLSEGVIIAEPGGRVTMLNGAAQAILGIGHDELLTVDALDRIETQDLAGRPLRGEERPLRRALRGEEFVGDEVLCLPLHGDPRGEVRVVSAGTSVRDSSGQVALAIVVFRDVTELRRLEKEREEYTALISHDLRNPLASVLMFAGVLRKSMQTKGLTEEASVLQRVERNALRMNAMLEELVDATSLELHATELHRLPLDLGEFVGGVVERLDGARTGRIVIEAGDGPPYIVFADALRIERCVVNLLTNALKYSPEESSVRIRLSRHRDQVVIDVIDSGIGVAPEALKRLFDRFYRTPGGKAKAEGLGLGLYIARLIVEAHGGRIEVHSEIGKGSTFSLILPPPREEERPPQGAAR